MEGLNFFVCVCGQRRSSTSWRWRPGTTHNWFLFLTYQTGRRRGWHTERWFNAGSHLVHHYMSLWL